MKHLKPMMVLTPEAIHLLERVKIHLEAHHDVLPTDSTRVLLSEFSELIEEIKN
jgi:hypothetical protein